MNLVKRREKRHNEKALHDIFLKTVRYLNQFRESGKCIDYIGLDVSRCNKTGQVLQKLEQLGIRAVGFQGWFQASSYTFEQQQQQMIVSHFRNSNLVKYERIPYWRTTRRVCPTTAS